MMLAARGPRGSNRVIRGGSWNSDASNTRAANRNNNNPDNRNNNIGFRLASPGNPDPRVRGVRLSRGTPLETAPCP
ncbi:MAG: SUMF1/EgtB/PvdO family nonheme iron enzyme [Candidatus Sericytochromatia bacterium]|nr:SUMF1/EgtB/PvdO family nonheme iron enzyme [Candidatus Tanganyikabacteria bacterium]